jgi:hypothetical protein
LIEQGFISDVYFGLASKMFVIYFSVWRLDLWKLILKSF